MKRTFLAAQAALLAGFVGLAGCGKGGGPLVDLSKDLSGKVTFNGQAVPGASVKVYPPTGNFVMGVTDKNGDFVIKGVSFEGECKVAIISSQGPNMPTSPEEMMKAMNMGKTAPDGGKGSAVPPSGSIPPEMEAKMKEMKNDPKMREAMEKMGQMPGGGPTGSSVQIPAKYGDVSKSGLTWTVSSDKSTRSKTFALTD